MSLSISSRTSTFLMNLMESLTIKTSKPGYLREVSSLNSDAMQWGCSTSHKEERPFVVFWSESLTDLLVKLQMTPNDFESSQDLVPSWGPWHCRAGTSHHFPPCLNFWSHNEHKKLLYGIKFGGWGACYSGMVTGILPSHLIVNLVIWWYSSFSLQKPSEHPLWPTCHMDSRCGNISLGIYSSAESNCLQTNSSKNGF